MVRHKFQTLGTLIITPLLVWLIWFILGILFFKPIILPPWMGPDLVPFHNMRNNFRVAPLYHLATCQIEKVASTMLTSVFCYLYDTDNFIKANRSIGSEDWDHRFCATRNEVFTLKNLTTRMGRDYTMLVLLRDPMERFISGYVDKCINEYHSCLGCYQDFRCLVNRIYGDLNYYQENKVKIEYNYIYAHFAPQTWYCSLNHIVDKVKYIRYGSHGKAKLNMINEMVSVLEARNVPKYTIEHISNVLNDTKSSHSTDGSKFSKIVREIIMEDNFLKMMIYKIYRYDFALYELLGSDKA